eukprot:9403392-Pyramimonas_sp.AAC.1
MGGGRVPKFTVHKLVKLYLAVILGWRLKHFVGASAVLPDVSKVGDKPMSMAAEAKAEERRFRNDASGALHTALLVDLDTTRIRK